MGLPASFLLPLRRFLPGLTALALMACSGESSVDATGSVQRSRVLVLSPAGAPAVEQVVAALEAHPQGAPRRAAAAADVMWVEDVAQVTAAVQQLKSQPPRYRAIFTTSITFARAVQLVAPDLPIVFEGVDDPQALCLVDSRRRPGRNATGYMHHLPDDEFKMLQVLRDAFPTLREVLMLVSAGNVPAPSCDPNDPYWNSPGKDPCLPGEHALDAYVQRRVGGAQLSTYAADLGLRLRFVVLCTEADFASLGGVASAHPSAAWIVPWHSLFDNHRAPLVAAINATARPAIYPNHGFARTGGLMSLAPLLDDGPDRASVLTLLKVLDGAEPATLPVQSPRGFSLVVNGATAARLSPRPSLQVLRRADTVLR